MKKKKKKTIQIKVTGAGFERFVDWMDSIVSELVEEMKAEMSSLAAGFSMRMRKRPTNTQREITPSFEGLDDKRFKQSGPTKEV